MSTKKPMSGVFLRLETLDHRSMPSTLSITTPLMYNTGVQVGTTSGPGNGTANGNGNGYANGHSNGNGNANGYGVNGLAAVVNPTDPAETTPQPPPTGGGTVSNPTPLPTPLPTPPATIRVG
jgi:hypothetical protein